MLGSKYSNMRKSYKKHVFLLKPTLVGRNKKSSFYYLHLFKVENILVLVRFSSTFNRETSRMPLRQRISFHKYRSAVSAQKYRLVAFPQESKIIGLYFRKNVTEIHAF